MQAPLVHIIDDDPAIRLLLSHAVGTSWGYRTVTFEDGEAFLSMSDEIPDLVLLDILLAGVSGVEVLARFKQQHPDVPVIVLSSQQELDVAIETMRLGALDYFTKPVDLRRLEYAVRNALQLGTLRTQVRVLQESLERSVHFDNIVASSGAMHEVLRLVEKACGSDITVLIEGESGTGKEMIARAIHFNGKRKAGPFVVLNCAAIPKDLLESELFGHEKGAFTGAVQRKRGKFEQADGGTIFLDEIGELDLALQAKLLRVLQQREFERVGGEETLSVDVRILSATNRDLREMSGSGSFREDLYYRLAVFPILLPPLRERRGDVALLADHFLRHFGGKAERRGLRFSPEALSAILAYPWPGNVRELMSSIERAVIMADTEEILPQDLPAAVTSAPATVPATPLHATSTVPVTKEERILPLEVVKERAIRDALHATGGALAETARRLGIGRTTLYNLIRRYGISEWMSEAAGGTKRE